MKFKIKYLSPIILTFAILPFFLISSCSKNYQVGYYINTTDLYSEDNYDTLTFTCKNSKSHDVDIEFEDDTYQQYFTIDGWNKNVYTMHYSTEVAQSVAVNFLIVKNDEYISKTVYLHNESDMEKFDSNNFKIHELSVRVIEANKWNVQSSSYKAIASGTTFITRKVLPNDPNFNADTSHKYQFYLIGNWHVWQMFQKINANSKYWTNGTDNTFNKFYSLVDLTQAYISNEHTNVGSDTYLWYADFNVANNEEFDDVNAMCDSNGYPLKLHHSSNENDFVSQQYFIGGYPANRNDPKKSMYKYISCHSVDLFGYKNKDWYSNPKELDSISHFLVDKSTWSIGNDIIMEPQTCEELSAGSSGSLVLDEDGNLIGIYWGGRVIQETNVYCGNIETLCPITNNDISGEFSDFSLSSNSSTHWFSNYIDMPVNNEN